MNQKFIAAIKTMVYFISIFRGKASEFISNIVLKLMLYIAKCKQNAHNDGNRAQPLKRLLETLFLAIKMCTGAHLKPVHIFMARNRVSKSRFRG